MKKIVFGLMLVLVVGCNGQENKIENNVSVTNDSIPFNEEFSFLIGKWKAIEYVSDGYATKNENGQTITFEKDGSVIIEKDNIKNNGKYEVQLRYTDKHIFNLHISTLKWDSYYSFSYKVGKSKKISLSPVTPEYEFICDEGCAYSYEKIK